MIMAYAYIYNNILGYRYRGCFSGWISRNMKVRAWEIKDLVRRAKKAKYDFKLIKESLDIAKLSSKMKTRNYCSKLRWVRKVNYIPTTRVLFAELTNRTPGGRTICHFCIHLLILLECSFKSIISRLNFSFLLLVLDVLSQYFFW